MPAIYKCFFYGIFIVVAFSIGLLTYTLTSHDTSWWELYADIFLFSLLAHSWFLAIALCIGEFRPRKFPTYAGQKRELYSWQKWSVMARKPGRPAF